MLSMELAMAAAQFNYLLALSNGIVREKLYQAAFNFIIVLKKCVI